MTKENTIKIFENQKVRSIWDSEAEKWSISIIDAIAVLTENTGPKRYWSVLKTRLRQEGCEPTTICSTLKMQTADGRMRLTQ